MTVRETVNASKEKIGPAAALELLAASSKVVVAKGKKVVTFEPKKASFDAAALEKAVIGPSGNLRAPTLRVGKSWFVGFSEEAYAAKFGG